MRLPTIKRRVTRTLEETLELSLAETTLSLRTLNSLESHNVWTVRELLGHTAAELLAIPHLGPKALNEIYAMLESLGLKRQSRKEEPTTAQPMAA